MRKLFRIGGSNFLASFLPVLSWLLLGIIVDPNLINVYSITYPLWFIYSLMICIFGSGANVAERKDKQQDGVLSEITVGSFLSIILCVILVLIIEPYLSFMNVDIETYKVFSIYSIIYLFINIIFALIREKMYFEHKDKEASIHTIIIAVLNLVLINGIALITKNQVIIISITLAIVGLYVLVLLLMQYRKFKLTLNFWPNIKYESENIVLNVLLFVTYFFGFSNTFVFGEEYLAAINLVVLVTDAQWDSCEAMKTVAKIDIVENKYDFKKTTKNSYVFVSILVLSSIVAFFALFNTYGVNLKLGLIYLSFDLFTMLFCAPVYFFEPMSQIEYSPIKNTIFYLICEIIRASCSIFIPFAFCTQIGQISCNLLLVTILLIVKKKHFVNNENGYLVRKQVS